jgi:hypothetical protein
MLGEPQNNAMQDYIANYSSRLDQLLGYSANLGAGAAVGDPAMGPNLGGGVAPAPAAPGGAPMMTDFNPEIANQRAQASMQGTAAGPQLKKNAQGQVQIDSRPPDFDFGVKDEDLKDVKTLPELIQKMPEQKANEYMGWWEQQYGDINSKYDAMLAELGERPDPRSRDLSRKDKFTMLMEFGLNLMKHSQRGGDRTGAVGAAIHDTVRGDQARRTEDFDRHRSLTNEIENRRSKELDRIGSKGSAMVAGQNLGATAAKEAREGVEFAERDDEVKQIVYGDEGVVGVNRKGEGKLVRDEAGSVVKSTLGLSRGSTRGAGGSGGYAPSDPEKRANFYSRVYKIPVDAALDIVRAEKSSADPFKAYTRIVDRLTAQFYPQEEAIRIAKEIIEGGYGAGILDEVPNAPRAEGGGGNLGASDNAPPEPRSMLRSPSQPPVHLLRQGVVRTIKNKRTGVEEKWTLDETGQPKRVLR